MMLSSDDEAEVVNNNVINYHFVDVKEEPICFSILPFQWEEGKAPDGDGNDVFLRGETTDALQKIFIKVIAWKLELEGVHPEIYVYTKDKIWAKLLKPRKSFESIIRKILITIQCLHYLKKNPESSEKSLWDHVRKAFSHYEDRPSISDLIGHESFIRRLIEKGKMLARPQLLLKLLDMKPETRVENDMDNMSSNFINDDDEKGDAFPYMEAADDSDDDEGELYDSVCAICDNGGEILPCEGRCLRSFHAFKEVSSEDSKCKTLGYSSKKAVDDLKRFTCPNCQWNKHQCSACGRLGSSDKSSGAEVFRCVSATCGHFYHPQCVAKLLHPDDDQEAASVEHKIAAGQIFICPVHKCSICKQGEDKKIVELQFAMCRRCPTSYHRKCLPREIVFAPSDSDSDSEEADVDTEESQTIRAWNNLLRNRILIYCVKHDIDPNLGTPRRNHLIFPKDPLSGEKRLTKRKVENLTREDVQESFSGKFKKLKTSTEQRKPNVSSKPQKSIIQNEITMRENSKLLLKRDMKPLKSVQRNLSSTQSKPKGASSSASFSNFPTSVIVIDSLAKERVMSLLRKSSSSSLRLDDFVKQKFVPSTHAYSARHIDKSITLGKVEGSIQAVKTALQKVDEDSGSIVNARDVCEPAMVNQMIKWRNKLAIYLSPFLHGLLYTSFGRHFTKVDILEEIVDRLHWYVKNGDTIVDFCCGANDFSILMNKKLEAAGKKCFYRNYDVIPPKNDFNFVKKDWMTVQTKDLPPGSQLIMGLNPPFGFKAALANKFIDKALEFKPKLLILIVPRETQRLDVKRGTKYDLIWEDDKKLSGKAFYLPGTVDVNDKQLDQWNVQPPPLSLWSRHDWTISHMEIAVNCRHRDPLTDAKIFDLQAEHLQSAIVPDKAEPLQGKDECRMISNISSNYKTLESNSNRKNDLEDAGSKLQNTGKVPKKSSNRKKFDRNELLVRGGGESSDMSISPGHSGPQNLSDHDRLGAPEVPKVPSGFRSTFGRSQDTKTTSKRNDLSVKSNSASGRDASLSRNLGAAGDLDHGAEEPGMRAQEFGIDDAFDVHSQYALDRSSAEDVHSQIQLYGQRDDFDLSRSRMIHGDASSGLTQANTLSSLYSFSGANGRHAQRFDEFCTGPAGSVGGLSTMDKYAPRLDEVNNRPLNVNPLSAVTSSSVMERHAPRLDEMNHVRRNTSPDIFLSDRGGIYGTSASRSVPGYGTNTTGFNTGWPYPPPHEGTPGWIDD